MQSSLSLRRLLPYPFTIDSKSMNHSSHTRHSLPRVFSNLYIAIATAATAFAISAAAAGSSAEPADTPAAAPNDSIPSASEPLDTLGAGYQDLQDLVVERRRNLVQSDGAKLTYNVTEDPEAGSSNILDILRKVPGVTVDGEENVKVNGQSNFRILLNGRDDPSLKGDIKTVLKSIPAAQIKKIEVISEPGAKYDAEGVGGILNIVTNTDTRLAGFTTNYNAWINASQVGGGINGRTRIKNVMLGASVYYNDGYVWPRAYHSERDVEQSGPAGDSSLHAESKGKSKWRYLGGNLNMSWEPDTLNLYTASLYAGWNPNQSNGYSLQALSDATGPVWSLERGYVSKGRYRSIGGQVSYQHNFRRTDHNLVVSYMIDASRSPWEQRFNTLNSFGPLQEQPYLRTNSNNDYIGHVAQIDYSNTLNKHNTIEAGAKADISRQTQTNSTHQGADAASAQFVDALYSDVSQFIDIYAAYATYTGSFGKWTPSAGVRYEHTRMGLDYHYGNHPDFTTRLNDIVPNAALSFRINDSSSLRASYQMRISRPSIGVLDPYVDTSNPSMISYGNPDLHSTKSHNISLSYSNYGHALSGTAKISYRHVANSINDVLFYKDNIMNSTYANIGLDRNVFLELNADWNITQSMRLSLYGWTKYVNVRSNSELVNAKNHGWQHYVNGYYSYTTPFKMRVSAYGGYGTGWIDLQGKGSSYYYYGLGLNRSFLKNDALTLSINASNILPVSRRSSYSQTGTGINLRSNNWYKQWNVGLSISFRFGELKAEVKQTAASVEKEQSSGSSSQK